MTKVLYIFLILLVSGCSSGIDPLTPQPEEPLRANYFIENLEVGVVNDNIVVQGTVTTSDSCGNFYQSLIIEDATGVLELRFSFYDTYSLFHRGDVVSVMMINREIICDNGLLSVDMGPFAIASQRVLRQGAHSVPVARVVKISELDSALIGRLIKFSDGRFDNGGREVWSGEQRYSVGKESVIVYTTPFASYAKDILPLDDVDIQGILTIYKGKFQLKMSSPLDARTE